MDVKNSRLIDAFEVCLAAMATGVDLDACVKLYPDLEHDLRPALVAASGLQSLRASEVPSAGMQRSRARMLARADELRRSRRPAFWQSAPRLALALAALVLVIFISLNGLVSVSAKSLPGDTLYPVKLAAENVSIQLATDAETRLMREEAYQERRAGEIRSLLEQERVHNISFEGVVEEINGDQLLVQGIPVTLNASAVVIGEVAPGRLVEVEGTTQPGGIVSADELHLRFFEYIGELQQIQTGMWRIGDRAFVILANTHLDPTLRLGEHVLVLVYTGDDGTPYAQAILRVPEKLAEPQSEFEPFEIEFTGVVEAIAGNELVIDGKTVVLTNDTDVKAAIAIGSLLKVHAIVSPDGSLTAREIQPADAPDNSGSDDDDNGEDDNPGGDDDGDDDDDAEDDDNSGSGNGDDDDDGGDGDDHSGSGGSDDDEDDGGDDDGGDDGDDHSGSGGSDDNDGGGDDDDDGNDDGSGGDEDGDDHSGSSGDDDHDDDGGDDGGSED
jgi:hypothetical protein